MSVNRHRPDLAAPEAALLIIADISGYTRYMTANAKTLAHSQGIITELIHTIILQIELPLEVAKLEGDAVFLFCRKENGAKPWPEARSIISQKLFTFFREFTAKLSELGGSNMCSCNACSHLERLRLKIVVHSGEVLFHRVLNFTELAGVDVILAHRLLKNSVKADQYLLLTEAAWSDLEFPADTFFVGGTETYENFARISTRIFFPVNAAEVAASVAAKVPFGMRFQRSWRIFGKLWFAPFTTRQERFRNVTTEVGAAAKYAYAFVIIILTPFFMPVGALLALVHAFKTGKTSHRGDCHEHRADGSCCQ